MPSRDTHLWEEGEFGAQEAIGQTVDIERPDLLCDNNVLCFLTALVIHDSSTH